MIMIVFVTKPQASPRLGLVESPLHELNSQPNSFANKGQVKNKKNLTMMMMITVVFFPPSYQPALPSIALGAVDS